MRYHQLSRMAVTAVTAALLAGIAAAQPLGANRELPVCPLLHAKAMPDGLAVEAMRFTGPSGEGRRGSAGFVVQTQDLLDGPGSVWKFVFQRDPSGFGFQVIHPLDQGHIVVSVLSNRLTIHRGGAWGDIGWGNPATSDEVFVNKGADKVLKLKTNEPHEVVSQLSEQGEYALWINDVLVCRHETEEPRPLRLTVPAESRFWGGSSWDRTKFAGKDFNPELKPGHAGLILGPMDGSGPRHFFKQITLASFPGTQPTKGVSPVKQNIDEHFGPLFRRIDDAREFDKLKRSRAVGGSRGGSFESIPDKPSLLVGFDYTTSTLYGGHLTVKAVRPVFRSRDGESNGKWHGRPHGKVRRIKAKDGYVVAGLVAKSGHRVDGMRVIFMRVKNGRLNPDDTYRSKWIGGHGGGAETLCAANGEPIVGVYGRQGHDVDSLGFIQIPISNSAATAPVERRQARFLPSGRGILQVTGLSTVKKSGEGPQGKGDCWH